VRRQLVSVDVAGRPASFIAHARQALAAAKLPAGTYVEFAPPQEGADLRAVLLRCAGTALAAMLALLLIAYGDIRPAVLVLASAAFALIGAVIAIAALGGVLTLGAVIGLVALCGLAARNAIIFIARLEGLMAAPHAQWSAELVRHAARERAIAVVSSALLVAVALAPLAIRAGAPGHEILGPMAIVSILGLATSALLGLFVSPALAYALWGPGRRPRA
jgi:Cu/Ag efflux pump CusA